MGTQFAKREGCFARPIAKSSAKCLKKLYADVAKLVDARDLKSHAFIDFIRSGLQNRVALGTETHGT